MKRLLLTAFLLLLPAAVQAQTTTTRVNWTQADPTPASLTYALTRNATAPVAVTGVTCAVSACQGTATFVGVTIISGDSFTLQAKAANGLVGPASDPFVISGPGKPGTVTVTVTVVVTP